MVNEWVLAGLANVAVLLGVWYYARTIEPADDRSELQKSTIVVVCITIIVGGGDFVAFTPLRAAVAVAVAVVAGHVVESARCTVSGVRS